MMPHMSWSVSHATGYRAEIYVAQPPDTVRHLSVAQPDAHTPATLAHRARAVRRHAEVPGERGDGAPALGVAGDHRAAVRLAEEHFVRRETCNVRREVDVEAEAGLVVRAAHGDLREGDAQPALGTVVRRAEQPGRGAGDEEVHETPFGGEVYEWRLAADEPVHRHPQRRPAHLGASLAQHEHEVSGDAGMTRDGAIRARQ